MLVLKWMREKGSFSFRSHFHVSQWLKKRVVSCLRAQRHWYAKENQQPATLQAHYA